MSRCKLTNSDLLKKTTSSNTPAILYPFKCSTRLGSEGIFRSTVMNQGINLEKPIYHKSGVNVNSSFSSKNNLLSNHTPIESHSYDMNKKHQTSVTFDTHIHNNTKISAINNLDGSNQLLKTMYSPNMNRSEISSSFITMASSSTTSTTDMNNGFPTSHNLSYSLVGNANPHKNELLTEVDFVAINEFGDILNEGE